MNPLFPVQFARVWPPYTQYKGKVVLLQSRGLFMQRKGQVLLCVLCLHCVLQDCTAFEVQPCKRNAGNHRSSGSSSVQELSNELLFSSLRVLVVLSHRMELLRPREGIVGTVFGFSM